MNIHLTASTPEVEKELNRLMLKLKATDPEFEKFLKVSISNSTPSAQWITIPGVLSDTTPTLSSLYEEGYSSLEVLLQLRIGMAHLSL